MKQHLSRRIAAAVAASVVLAASPATEAAGFVDVLDVPAKMSPLASHSPLQAIAAAGTRWVAVGARGHVVVSSDGGATWKQSQVPVSSDLTAVHFATASEGWAVGHDGVILHTSDGGERWELQLDGRKANALLVAAMERKAAAEPSETAKTLLAEAKRYQEQGPDKPFLDVWFADARNGYAVGAFNLIFRTSDGGKTWEPWFDRTDNPKFFNLYSIRPAGRDLYIAGEGGLVLRLDPTAQRFKALALPYNGSFFGVTDAGNAVLVFGLRGNAYRSTDGTTWTKVDAGLSAAIVGATRGAAGAVLLADAGGRLAASDDDGRTFRAVALDKPMPLTGFAERGEGRYVLVGPRGVSVAQAAAR